LLSKALIVLKLHMWNKIRPTCSILTALQIGVMAVGILNAVPQVADPSGVPAKPDPMPHVTAPQQQITHTVVAGDNLWDLARHYKTSVGEFKAANQLKSIRLHLGQVLILPGAAVIPAPSSKHTVQEGDNLWNLARQYHTSVEELMELNQLKTHRLHLGQELRLPAPEAASLRSFSKQRIPVSSGQANPVGATAPLAAAPPTDPLDVILHETSDVAAIRSMMLAGTSDSGQEEEPPGETPAPTLTLREQLAIAGLNFLGVRYRWNGTSESRGFDCSGLVQRLYSLFSIDLPRSSREQFKIGEKIARAALEIGDLVFFSSRGGKIPSHVGIYIGGEQFLHAASRGKKVIISKLTEEWYSRRFIGARRILDLWKGESRITENQGK